MMIEYKNGYLYQTRNLGKGLKVKDMQFKKVKQRKWLRKIQCFLFGHWWVECPDGSGDKFCERGCGK